MPHSSTHPRLALYELGSLHLRITRECSRLLHQMSLPVHIDQAPIIIFLRDREGASQQELAQGLERDRASINRTVSYLSRNSLVSIEPDGQDKRKTIVKLTLDGKKIAKELDAVLEKADEALTATLTAEERQQLSFLLDKLADTII